MKKLLLFFCLLLTSLGSKAHDFEVNGIYYKITSSSYPYTVAVTYRGSSYSSYSYRYTGSVIIPKSVTYNSTTYSVTSIGGSAFQGCSGLTSITIPNSMTNIESYAFKGCTGLKNLVFEDGDSELSLGINYYYKYGGNGLFYNCPLETLYLGRNISYDSDAGHGFSPFCGNTTLTSITIGNSVTSIGDHAFYNCSGLTSIIIPNSVTSIKSYAFFGCTGLTSVTIGNSVTSIGESAFNGCTGLTSITIPNNVTNISNYAFNGCTSLKNLVFQDGDSLLSLGYNYSYSSEKGKGLFYDCPLEALYLGRNISYNSWSEYGYSPFYGKTALTSVTIGNSVTSIDHYAFSGCSGLTSVSIPNSVTSICYQAFNGCTGLTKAEFASIEGLCNISFGENANPLYYAHHLYIGGNEVKNLVIPNSVKSISGSTFVGCSGLETIVVNSGNTVYDSRERCNAIIETASNTLVVGCKNTIVPNNVTSIAGFAFYGCTGLTSIDIPNSVISIGQNAFSGTAWYDNQPNGLVYAGKVAYSYKGTMYGGTSIGLKEGTLGIADYAFSGRTGLKSIIIPNSVTTVGDGAFSGCTGLTSVSIGNSVTSIASSTFKGCTGLTSITILDGTSTLKFEGSDHFKDAGSLSDIYIGRNFSGSFNYSTYSTIYPFNTISTLKTLTLGDNVTSVSSKDFSECKSLSTVNIGNNIRYVYNSTFPSTAKIYVNRATTSLIKLWKAGFIPYEKGTEKLMNPFGESERTASSMNLHLSFVDSLATNITNKKLSVNGMNVENDTLFLSGLDPNTSYDISFYCICKTRYYNGSYYSSDYDNLTFNINLSTDALDFTTQLPKVISEGNVIVSAKSNLDDVETNVGFEWRRQDWNDDFDSKTGGAYLYNGEMEGYIRSINPNYLWKFRPYYISDSGKSYYGEWKGMDPSDYSYFEPTVHTYASVTVNENTAMVKGYAQRGTDNVTSQGFLYWPNNGNNVKAEQPMRVTEVPDEAQKVTAKGTVMTAKLTGLSYDTTYSYVAFVETSEGETFYGEEMTFQTGDDLTGIEPIHNAPSIMHNEEAIYDLQGRRQTKMQKGINIIRMSNGTTKKVLVK